MYFKSIFKKYFLFVFVIEARVVADNMLNTGFVVSCLSKMIFGLADSSWKTWLSSLDSTLCGTLQKRFWRTIRSRDLADYGASTARRALNLRTSSERPFLKPSSQNHHLRLQPDKDLPQKEPTQSPLLKLKLRCQPPRSRMEEKH